MGGLWFGVVVALLIFAKAIYLAWCVFIPVQRIGDAVWGSVARNTGINTCCRCAGVEPQFYGELIGTALVGNRPRSALTFILFGKRYLQAVANAELVGCVSSIETDLRNQRLPVCTRWRLAGGVPCSNVFLIPVLALAAYFLLIYTAWLLAACQHGGGHCGRNDVVFHVCSVRIVALRYKYRANQH